MNVASRFPDPFPPPFASAWGDDTFGLWAEFSLFVSESSGSVSQCLRWIEPGTFQMGSPDEEPERRDNEGPQHDVFISSGFWLADTACTQDLWQAVMGGNPRYFNGDYNHPVERVSWLDVQAFLQHLQTLLPGCGADLPSEAEWEYACRASTKTQFSFGADINTQEVNYYGEYPYPGGKKGVFRGKTVPVKSLPANPWGLYEMHGNVREWCKDGMRSYDGQAQIDPLWLFIGDGQPRVVRGGSWSSGAGGARSADRNAHHPGFVNDDLGFRFCLRPIQTDQVSES